MSTATITTLRPEFFAPLAQLQRDCYPTLDPIELMTEEHFEVQHSVFAEGQFVALLDGRVVGMGSGFFCKFDFEDRGHTFREFCDQLYFRNHDPDGPWYYGADISVHPICRGHGIGRLLYEARKKLVSEHHKRGIVAGGLIPGYAEHKQTLTPQQYVDRVVAGELFDSTLSFQLRNGFEVRGLLQGYLEDEASDNWATLIVWERAI